MLYAQKVRYTAQTVRMMSEPTCDPTVSVSSPISGGMIAPPQTPVIIRPEISLALSGRRRNASE